MFINQLLLNKFRFTILRLFKYSWQQRDSVSRGIQSVSLFQFCQFDDVQQVLVRVHWPYFSSGLSFAYSKYFRSSSYFLFNDANASFLVVLLPVFVFKCNIDNLVWF